MRHVYLMVFLLVLIWLLGLSSAFKVLICLLLLIIMIFFFFFTNFCLFAL